VITSSAVEGIRLKSRKLLRTFINGSTNDIVSGGAGAEPTPQVKLKVGQREAYDSRSMKFLRLLISISVRIPFVWVPNTDTRYGGEIRERLRDICTELCEWQEITILEGAIKDDHVHMYLSVPPKHHRLT